MHYAIVYATVCGVFSAVRKRFTKVIYLYIIAMQRKNVMLNGKTFEKKTLIYILLFVAVTVIWGASFPLNKIVLEHKTPVFLLIAGRFAFGALTMFILSLFKNKGVKIKKPEVAKGTLLGAVIFVAFALQTFGLLYTSPDKNSLLTGIYVLLIPLFKMFGSKKAALKPIVDGVICIIGMLIFFEVWNQNLAVNVGDILTIAGAIFFAAQFLLLEKFSPSMDSINFTLFQMITISVLAMAASLAFEIDSYRYIEIPYMLGGFIVLGVLASGLAFLAQTFVQTKLKAQVVSLIAALEIVFAMVFSIALGYSKPTLYFWLGSSVIFVSIVSGCLSFGNKKPHGAQFIGKPHTTLCRGRELPADKKIA
jgi:drug/metabolite transporter (DMT)-like permease